MCNGEERLLPVLAGGTPATLFNGADLDSLALGGLSGPGEAGKEPPPPPVA